MRMFAWLLLFFLSLPVLSQAANNKKQVKLIIRDNSSGLSDEATIYFDNGSSLQYIFSEDAKKVFNPTPLVPQIYSLTSDSIPCLLNSYGNFSGPATVRLGVKVDTAGEYGIYLNMLDNFDPTSLVLLEDKQTGQLHDLRGSYYHFSLSSAQLIPDRFVLHISYPAIIAKSDADCNNLGGSISITQDTSIAWTTCTAFDSVGFPMGSYNNINGNFSFNTLPEGNYGIVFTYNSYSTTKYVYVAGNKVSVFISASPYTATTGQVVHFYSSASNTVYYTWDFGESTIITNVANPEISYSENGVYQVVLTCSNDSGCFSSDTVTITITDAVGIADGVIINPKVYNIRKEIFIQYPSFQGSYNYSINTILGETVTSGKAEGTLQRIPLTEYPDGLYILTLSNKSYRFSKKLLLKD